MHVTARLDYMPTVPKRDRLHVPPPTARNPRRLRELRPPIMRPRRTSRSRRLIVLILMFLRDIEQLLNDIIVRFPGLFSKGQSPPRVISNLDVRLPFCHIPTNPSR